MELKELIEHLKDMKLLYGNAVVHVKSDQNEYRIKSVEGFMGEKRPNECRDPHVVVFNVKNIKTIHPKKKAGKKVSNMRLIDANKLIERLKMNCILVNYGGIHSDYGLTLSGIQKVIDELEVHEDGED